MKSELIHVSIIYRYIILYIYHSSNEFTCNALQNYSTDFDKIMLNVCDLVQLKT